MRKVQSCCPCKILIPYRNCIDRELNTTIADFTHIGYDSTIRINERRYWIIPDQILGILVVILDRSIDTTIEEGIIQTNVQHTGFLPLQIRISQLGSYQCSIVLTIDGRYRTIRTIGSYSSICTKAKSITTYTITHAKFQVRKLQGILPSHP